MIKKVIKYFLPNFFLKYLKKILIFKRLFKYKRLSNEDIFRDIYNNKLWSPEEEEKHLKFYSGTGSHLKEFKNIYFKHIKEFLLQFNFKLNAVDLGCGDFSIGSEIRKYCGKYIAIDIFDDLIDYNKKFYKNYDVDFKVLDITKDELPKGDICFLRQVLQHLSNENIKKFLNQMKGKYKYLVLTEHLPNKKIFKSNKDIITGPEIRLYKNSGVILTESPFNLKPIHEISSFNISSKEIVGFEGVLNTKIYQLIN